MAKWGEGDPRWIVEERADATNVNNWHWSEKNATNWSKDKLKELLTGLKIENAQYSAQIKEITKCEGEATANNRKAKLIFFYEWVINGDWEATLKSSENKTVYKGNFEVPNLSEEHDRPEDVDVSIHIKDSKQQKLYEFMKTEGIKLIREQFAAYIRLLKEEYSQGLILPTNKENAPSTTPLKTTPGDKKIVLSPETNKALPASASSDNGSGGVKILTKKLTLTEEFKCQVGEIYDVFVDINRVRAFTHHQNIVYEPEKGGKFALFDSNVTGSFIELVRNKKIVMSWRNKRWPENHFSTATLEFAEKEDCTEISLSQTGIPQNFVENTEEGWKNFYFHSIKQTFGYGSRLM